MNAETVPFNCLEIVHPCISSFIRLSRLLACGLLASVFGHQDHQGEFQEAGSHKIVFDMQAFQIVPDI
jgi:hypothetical protein